MKDEFLPASGERIDRINDDVTLIEKTNGLTFGTDAYLLSAFCRPARRAAELGTGTGAVSLLLAARRRYEKIFAAEIQPDFAELAARNAALNGFSDTVKVLLRDVRDLTPADTEGETDAVFANPPYLRVGEGYASPHGEKQIARHEVCGNVADFAAAAARILRYGGCFYTVFRPNRLDALFAALRENRLTPKVMLFVCDHPEKAPSMVLTEARLGAGEGLSVLPPLFLHDAAGDPALSARAAEIYETGTIKR